MKYDFSAVEKKWQDIWEQKGSFHASTDYTKPKFYGLVEFPYPSGQGLHVGHPRSYTALDAICRQKRLQGYNVLYPMGWDAFGLPTENYAIANKMKPAVVTQRNVARFKSQLQALGLSFDWSREINTTDPDYYKWTQWIFLKFFEKGLAYKKEMSVNWCPSCKVVLANEESTGGVCERCGATTTQKTKSQWMLAITQYAQRLIDDLDDLGGVKTVGGLQGLVVVDEDDLLALGKGLDQTRRLDAVLAQDPLGLRRKAAQTARLVDGVGTGALGQLVFQVRIANSCADGIVVGVLVTKDVDRAH